MAPRTRLIDVAVAAGVSKATASRVLNNDPGFSTKSSTKEAVLAAADSLGYAPHSGARALAGMPTKALLLISPSMDNPTHSTIARGANARAMERGYVTLMVEDFGGAELFANVISLVEGGRVDGVIVGSATPDHPLALALAGSDFPHVFVNRAIAGSGRNIVSNFALSSETAVAHLVSLGHRRIGHISGPTGIVPSDERARAFRAAIAAVPGAEGIVVGGEFSEAGGYNALAAMLEQSVTAVFTSSLAQGIGALRCAAVHGIAVPAQLSIIANDDFPVAAFTSPPLTTVRTPLFEMGQQAADSLIAQITSGDHGDEVVQGHVEVVHRLSTGEVTHE